MHLGIIPAKAGIWFGWLMSSWDEVLAFARTTRNTEAQAFMGRGFRR